MKTYLIVRKDENIFDFIYRKKKKKKLGRRKEIHVNRNKRGWLGFSFCALKRLKPLY